MLAQKGIDNTVNLTGFSRGSIICIHIANRLYERQQQLESKSEKNDEEIKLLERLQNVKLHLYVNDPVAGMGNKGDIHARKIPPNVKEYVTVLQTHEMRRDFKPQDMSRAIIDSSKTKFTFQPIFGNHTDSIKVKKEMSAAAEINWHSLYSFLQKHGAEFRDGQIPTLKGQPTSPETIDKMNIRTRDGIDSVKLLNSFNSLHQQREYYERSGGRWRTISDSNPFVFRKSRRLNQRAELYVRHDDFFVNQLERELFKISYPRVFNYLFEGNIIDSQFSSASDHKAVIEEFRGLTEKSSELYIRLQKFGVSYDSENNSINRGRIEPAHCLESMENIQLLFPDMLGDGFQRDPEVAKLAQMERDIYMLTLLYEREKSEFNAFSGRSKADIAKEIRKQTKAIVEAVPGTYDNKQKALLNMLESHYLQLKSADQSSALGTMLEKYLSDNGRRYEFTKPSALKSVASSAVKFTFNLVREIRIFVGTLGYVGGGALSFTGLALRDLGQRTIDTTGKPGFNTWKLLKLTLAYPIKYTEIVLKERLGLKYLTNKFVSAMNAGRDGLIRSIHPVEVQITDVSKLKQAESFPHAADASASGKLSVETQPNVIHTVAPALTRPECRAVKSAGLDGSDKPQPPTYSR